jgi:hypothetical protein
MLAGIKRFIVQFASSLRFIGLRPEFKLLAHILHEVAAIGFSFPVLRAAVDRVHFAAAEAGEGAA